MSEPFRVRVERPELPKTKSVVVRFLEKVDIREGGCWLWRGWVEENGYGGFRHGETNWAHRAAYILFRGPIPEGLTIDHLCYEKLCVNPDHLDAVDAILNRRRESRGWSACDENHPDTDSRVTRKKNGAWRCAECHRVKAKLARARLAAPRLPHAREVAD